MTPLFRMAIIAGSSKSIADHLERGATPDDRDGSGATALMVAAARGRLEVCRLLLDRGAVPTLTDPQGRTAQTLALMKGHGETADLLASAVAPSPALVELVDVEHGLDGGDGEPSLWEVEAEIFLPADDRAILAEAARIQIQIAQHYAPGSDEDWSDIEIEIPDYGRRRDWARARHHVRFRRLTDGKEAAVAKVARPNQRAQPRKPEAEDEIVALDLSQGPDEILRSMTLAQIVRGTDASAYLRRCVPRNDLFRMTASEFLEDADGEARFCKVGGINVDDYLELSDLVNAFTVLVHRDANQESAAPAWAASQRSTPVQIPPKADDEFVTEGDPEERLRLATLAHVVINGRSSPNLRKALQRTELSAMSVYDFLLEDDSERKFREQANFSTKDYLELDVLVNAYTTVVHEDAKRRFR